VVADAAAGDLLLGRFSAAAHSLAVRERDPRRRHWLIDGTAASTAAADAMSADAMSADAMSAVVGITNGNAVLTATRTDASIAVPHLDATGAVMGDPELLAAPVVSSVTPNLGPPAGGTSVTISGTGFTGATSVRFAGQPATNVIVVSDTSITCKTPPASADGFVSVAVTTPGGTGASGPSAFDYTGATGTTDVFPAFVPIIPPPPIGAAQAIPAFPPPTPPPIGHVPVGQLVGPAIAPAAVPPSLAGVVQPQYKTGSATTPPGYFPSFTTTGAYAGFPNNPPAGVPIVFSNISTNPSRSGGVWTVVPPPSTPTIAQITLNGASNLTPHMADFDVGSIRLGHEEPAERHAGAVLSGSNPSHLHQPQQTKSSRRKRLSESGPAGHSNNT
jgi:hypothetical protein